MPKRKIQIDKIDEQEIEVTPSKQMNLIPKAVKPMRNLNYWVGAHVSASGGPQNALVNINKINGHAFALFLKNQRRWVSPDLSKKAVEDFKNGLLNDSFFEKSKDKIVPHGSYLINMCNPDKQALDKSYNAFIDDLKRCELLGINLYNFHPGSCVGKSSKEEAISQLAQCINKAHKETSKVVILIENMSGQKNIIGSKFEELKEIIDQIEDKTRIGVCFDTCHAFAAGYDLRTKDSFNRVFSQFESIIGINYLRAFHLNDSKENLGCGKDRHENLGRGKIGLDCFKFIMNDERFQHMPLVLETPLVNDSEDIYKDEINLLYSLCKI